MESTHTEVSADQRTKDHTIGVASQAGLPTPEIGGELANTNIILGSPRDMGGSTSATDVEDDGINPGDALEVMLEGDGEEVRV